jgi:hypothetical protein
MANSIYNGWRMEDVWLDKQRQSRDEILCWWNAAVLLLLYRIVERSIEEHRPSDN